MGRNSIAVDNSYRGKKKADTAGVLPPLNSLKCAYCDEYLNDPVTLPCLHSFCRSCLEKYNNDHAAKEHQHTRQERGESEETEYSKLESKDGRESRGRSPSSPGKSGKEESKNAAIVEESLTVLCPTCIENLGLAAPTEPQVPFENSRLARIVGLVHDANIVCQNCADATSEIKCKTCNAWLCLECKDETHGAPIFKTHEMVGLTHAEMMALPKCETHPMNDLEFFSTEEEVGVCQVCLLKGDFVGKPYCLVSDVRKARQHEIERGVKVILEEKEKLLTGKQRMEQVLDMLGKKLESQTDAVKQNFAAIRAALDRREKEALGALKELKDAKAKVMGEQIEQVDKILGVVNDGVNNVRLVLHHSNDLELVYLTIVLQEFIAELSKIDAPKFKFSAESLEHYHSPAVDANLPVLLSDKIPNLVEAYAPVPRPNLQPSKPSQPGGPPSPVKLSVDKPELTKQQKVLLDEVGAKGKADEYGCVVQ